MTAPELADKLEVSRRTINRDIDELCKSGIPIITHRGIGGGIQIAGSYTLDKTMLTIGELENLVMGLKALDSISADSSSSEILDKLGYGNDHTLLVNDYIGIDLASHYKNFITKSIKVIKEAIYLKKHLNFTYYSKKGKRKIVAEPYFLLFKWNSWYLYSYDTEKSDFRLYKLNRISGLKVSKEYFIPRDLSIEQLKMDSYFTDNILLKAVFSPKMKYRIIDEYGLDSFFIDKEGNIYFERLFTDKEYLIQWILSFGCDVKVYEPRDIIKEIIRHAGKLLEIYEET